MYLHYSRVENCFPSLFYAYVSWQYWFQFMVKVNLQVFFNIISIDTKFEAENQEIMLNNFWNSASRSSTICVIDDFELSFRKPYRLSVGLKLLQYIQLRHFLAQLLPTAELRTWS